MLFAMTSKVRKERRNFKINRKSGRFKKLHKSGRYSALSEDLAGLNMKYIVHDSFLSIWVKPQATTNAGLRPVEEGRNVAFRFKRP